LFDPGAEVPEERYAVNRKVPKGFCLEAVVVVSADQFARLRTTAKREPLVDFLKGLDLEGLDLTRERDVGRGVAL
jgi:hypothetical protein